MARTSNGDNEGLSHCGAYWKWMELKAVVRGDTWFWSCPSCHREIASLPWRPPADMPSIGAVA